MAAPAAAAAASPAAAPPPAASQWERQERAAHAHADGSALRCASASGGLGGDSGDGGEAVGLLLR